MGLIVVPAVGTVITKPVQALIFSGGSGQYTTRSLSTRSLTGITLQENDLIVQVANNNGAAPVLTDPVDWINAFGANTAIMSTNNALIIMLHRVTAAEITAGTTSWTLTNIFSSSQNGRQWTTVLRGVDPTTPLDTVVSNPNSGGAMIIPDITPTKDGSFVMGFGMPDDIGNAIASVVSPWVEGLRVSDGTSTSGLIMYQTDPKPAGVLVPGASQNMNHDDEYVAATIAFAVGPQ